ncbi:MAG: isoprenoid biosynthesis glyoxalase ElbB [Bacteroidota bacterium]
MKKFAIILAGCGVYDGAEIQEATLSLYMIKKHGADYQVFAPDIPQYHVINHMTGKEMPEQRNVLVESARIARGNVLPLSALKADAFDAILFPGGFGAAKNLCNFAIAGENCEVNKEVASSIHAFLKSNKPVGALCISPVILAKLIGDVAVTIGDDPGTAAKVQKMGAIHINTTHGQVIRDPNLKVFTTPCYNIDANIVQVADGIENIVKAMLAEA